MVETGDAPHSEDAYSRDNIFRREVEDILAGLDDASDCLRVAIAHALDHKPQDESELRRCFLLETYKARRAIERTRQRVVAYHPDKEEQHVRS